MTPEETALEIVEFFEEQPGSHRRAVMEDMIVAAIRERDARWKPYANHRDRCAAFPATSEEQILRDCSCGLRALLEEAGK